jgi:hypothetical protein
MWIMFTNFETNKTTFILNLRNANKYACCCSNCNLAIKYSTGLINDSFSTFVQNFSQPGRNNIELAKW